MGLWGGGGGLQGGGPSGSPFPWWAFRPGFAPTPGIQRGEMQEGGKPLPSPPHNSKPGVTPDVPSPPPPAYPCEEGASAPGFWNEDFGMRGCPPTEVKVETRGPSGAYGRGVSSGGGELHCSIASFPFLIPSVLAPLTECGGDSPMAHCRVEGNPPHLPAYLLCLRAPPLLSSLSSTPPPPPH